jgi:hypothetical protein
MIEAGLASQPRRVRPAPALDAMIERRYAMTAVKYRSVDVDGVKVFYREAGAADARSCCFCSASRAPVTCSGT